MQSEIPNSLYLRPTIINSTGSRLQDRFNPTIQPHPLMAAVVVFLYLQYRIQFSVIEGTWMVTISPEITWHTSSSTKELFSFSSLLPHRIPALCIQQTLLKLNTVYIQSHSQLLFHQVETVLKRQRTEKLYNIYLMVTCWLFLHLQVKCMLLCKRSLINFSNCKLKHYINQALQQLIC